MNAPRRSLTAGDVNAECVEAEVFMQSTLHHHHVRCMQESTYKDQPHVCSLLLQKYVHAS